MKQQDAEVAQRDPDPAAQAPNDNDVQGFSKL